MIYVCVCNGSLSSQRYFHLRPIDGQPFWFGACWLDKMKKKMSGLSLASVREQQSLDPSSPEWGWEGGGDNKKPHLPFQHPPDHYHNSAPPVTLGSRDTEMTQNFASATSLFPQRNRDVKSFFFLFLVRCRVLGGCGVGAEISQGLWSHSWYKKGEAFDVAMELCSNEARYAAICPCQTRGGITEWQPAR